MSATHPTPPLPIPMFMPPGGPKPHSHLECGGCRTLLMYPQGAGNVRCSRCTHITPVPPASTEAAQIVCNNCRMLLSYPKGAQSVQCSMCHNVTQVPAYGHLMCGGCSIMLMYPTGAESVKCSVCHYVTPVDSDQQQQEQKPASDAPQPPSSTKEDRKGEPSVVPADTAQVRGLDGGVKAEGASARVQDVTQQQQQRQPKEGTPGAGYREAGAEKSQQENSKTSEVPNLEASVKK